MTGSLRVSIASNARSEPSRASCARRVIIFLHVACSRNITRSSGHRTKWPSIQQKAAHVPRRYARPLVEGHTQPPVRYELAGRWGHIPFCFPGFPRTVDSSTSEIIVPDIIRLGGVASSFCSFSLRTLSPDFEQSRLRDRFVTTQTLLQICGNVDFVTDMRQRGQIVEGL